MEASAPPGRPLTHVAESKAVVRAVPRYGQVSRALCIGLVFGLSACMESGGSGGERVAPISRADMVDDPDQSRVGSGPRFDGGSARLDASQPIIDASSPRQPRENGPYWLSSVYPQARRLMKIDIATGRTAVACQFQAEQINYPSTTFGRDGVLDGFNGPASAIDIIDPCTCEVRRVGRIEEANGNVFNSVPGITANGLKMEALFGLSTDQDVLLDMDDETAQAEVIGALGEDFSTAGTTWSTEHNGLYAINGRTEQLYEVNKYTGEAVAVADLDIDFGSVGIEYHVGDQALYGCTDRENGTLYRIDTVTGRTTLVATLGYRCNNLAAPWTPVPCLDELEVGD